MVNNEKEEVSTKLKWSMKFRRLKLVQHCIQLTIAKIEKICKIEVNFLVYDIMFVNNYCAT